MYEKSGIVGNYIYIYKNHSSDLCASLLMLLTDIKHIQ